jgi:hypothetical protein
MYMPGLTSGQAPLGGSGFTPESLRTANQGLSLADRAGQTNTTVASNNLGGIGGDGEGIEVGFDQNASGFGGGSNSFGMSASNLGNAIAQGVDALGLTSVFSPSLVSEEDAAPISYASFDPGQGLGSGYLSVDDRPHDAQPSSVLLSQLSSFVPRYAEGGNVSSTAQDLASRGRGGDTMLVHMAPHEVAGLNALARMQGTELTINPETGMPEALKLGKLFKTLAPFIPFIPGVGQFLAPAFGALGMGGFSPLLQKAITSGIVGGFTGPKGGFDLQRGLMQGITAYGLGSLQQNLGGPSTPGGPPASGGPVNVDPSMGGVPPPMTGQNPLAGMEYMNTPVTGGNPLEGSQFINTIKTPGDITAASKAAEATRAGFPLSDVERGGVSDLSAPFEYQPVSPKNAATTASGMKTPTALLTTGFGLSSIAESDKLASAQMAAQREKEEEEDLYRRLFESTLGQVRTAKAGGLMKLAGGGMSYMEAGGTTGPTGAPRDVTGTGDGMSDSVPASIEGVQEARLADGEFVIPADVVADIGNGSSDAGSKKLYDMMDRVRKARHGTTEQPPEIKAERLMPA